MRRESGFLGHAASCGKEPQRTNAESRIISITTVADEQPERAPAPTSVLICGMIRSGSTLLCDLLSLPGRAYVMSEPMLFNGWDAQRYEEIRAAASSLEIALPPLPDEARRATLTPARFFSEKVEPALAGLNLWGLKEVMLRDWRALIAHHDFDHLLVLVRDLRDIALSAVDLVRGAGLAFPGGRRIRDEAWLVTRLAHDTHEIAQLTLQPHRLIRYEDLTTKEAARKDLARNLGLPSLGETSASRTTTTRGRRRREVEKHGDAPSDATVARHTHEPVGPARALADYVWRLAPAYSECFDYEVPEPFSLCWSTRMASMNDAHPAPWPLMEDGDWTGPRGLDPWFARRRARALAAANIAPGTRVMDIGCVLPVLAFMLPRDTTYLGVDLTGEPPLMTRADWMTGELPEIGETSLITVLGALEFVPRPAALLQALRDKGRPIMLTYHARDDTGATPREELGWQNHLSRAELVEVFGRCRLRPQVLWRFDGYQSFFRLTPV
jgi:hypothetical protein